MKPVTKSRLILGGLVAGVRGSHRSIHSHFFVAAQNSKIIV